MSPFALRNETRRGRFGRVLSGDTHLVRDAGADPSLEPFDLVREMKMQEIRERIAHDAYSVDPKAVADAIVARLMAGHAAEHDAERN